jgi:hypothetical protein
VIYLDVAKVDLDISYVAMTIHTCFKCFIYFQTYVANISSGCFKCRYGRVHVSSTATAMLLLWGAPPWVTVQAPEASRRLRGTSPQAGQVTRTQVGPGDGHSARDGLLERGMGAGATCGHRGIDAGWDAVWVMGCGAGAAPGRAVHPDIWTLALPFFIYKKSPLSFFFTVFTSSI